MKRALVFLCACGGLAGVDAGDGSASGDAGAEDGAGDTASSPDAGVGPACLIDGAAFKCQSDLWDWRDDGGAFPCIGTFCDGKTCKLRDGGAEGVCIR